MSKTGDNSEYLAVGYLPNQGILQRADEFTGNGYDEAIDPVFVRSMCQANYEDSPKKNSAPWARYWVI